MQWLAYLVTALIAYLLGSFPTGYLAGRARGIDIRQAGSGNIGATNVFRTLGRRAGIGVLLADALKGWLAIKLVPGFVQLLFSASTGVEPAAAMLPALEITAGVAVILGHNYTCWLRFRGGKGVATSGGVLIALLPNAFLVVLVIWLIVFAVSRYVSLASVFAAVALPLATWRINGRMDLILVTTLLAAMAVYKHRSNIKRLLNGTENRFGKRKEVES